jgi:C4-dicarboxylate-specific signal transduction histidine kinase
MDFGTGIEHHLIDRVFDPFFSTKPNGEGTGLGLSISYGLIRDNGGSLRIKSLHNSYTTVSIDLPAAEKRSDHHG